MMQYILPMARNSRTGQRVKYQDLKGVRYGSHQRTECQMMAEKLAADMSRRGVDQWEALVEPYTPTERR